jgi:hypothetical protein
LVAIFVTLVAICFLFATFFHERPGAGQARPAFARAEFAPLTRPYLSEKS